MSIGPKDYIEELLVRKYANQKMENHNIAELAVPADKMLKTMNDYALVHRNMLAMQVKLKTICNNVNVQAAYQRMS